MSTPDTTLARIAAQQFSCFSRAQATQSGFSAAQIRRRVANGRWIRRHDAAFQLAGAPLTYEARIAAAVLALPGAFICAGSAAFMRDGTTFEPTRPCIVRSHGHSRKLSGVCVRQSTYLPPHHVTLLGGLPITTRARTVFDLAATVGAVQLGRFLDAQLIDHHLHLRQLDVMFNELARPGRAGSRRMAEVLDERIGGALLAESELELRYHDLCRRHDLPMGVSQFAAPWDPGGRRRERVDVGYPKERLIVELDGRRYHGLLEAFERDRCRDQRAAAAGWRTIRFTWTQVTRDEGHVAQILRSALTSEP